jgi:flagellar hook assembly protein FlgD
VRLLEPIGTKAAGRHEVRWDATDRFGREVNAGVYIYRLEVNGTSHSGRLVIIR